MLILYLTIYAPMKFQNFTVLVRYCNLESPKRKHEYSLDLVFAGDAGDGLLHLGGEGHGLVLQLLGRLPTLDPGLVELGNAALGEADVLDGLPADVLGNRARGAVDDGVLGDADLVLLVDVGVLPLRVDVRLGGLPDGADLSVLGGVLDAFLLLRPEILDP